MKKKLIRDSSVGFVLFIATLVTMAGLFMVGQGPGIFANQVEYKVLLRNAVGLRQGSRVYLSGVPVGSVAHIDFPPDLKGDKVLVTLAVNQQYARRIGESSVAWLKNEGLMGDTALHISLSGQSPELAPGSEIPYRPRAMLDDFAGEGTTQTATDLLETAVRILKDFQKGEGSLGQLLKNPDLYDNLNSFTMAMNSAVAEVERVSKEVQLLLSAVRSQKGTLGKLIFSEAYALDVERSLKGARGLIARLDNIAARIESGTGSIGKLVADPEFYDALMEAVEGLSGVARATEGVVGKLDESGSVVGRLLRDDELGDRFTTLVERLARGAGSLESILEKVASGEGSIGMLVHDPSIAGSLRDVFLGVQELRYLENLVRNAEKVGRDAYLRAAHLNEARERELIRMRSLARLRGETDRSEAPAMPEGQSTVDSGTGGREDGEAKVVPASATTKAEEESESNDGC